MRNIIKCESDTKFCSLIFTLSTGETLHVLTDGHNIGALQELVRTSPLRGRGYVLVSEISKRCCFVDSDGNRI